MKKSMLIFIFLYSSILFGKNRNNIANDTIWYDQNYKVTIKENASIYKLRPYLINNKYLHVYFYKSNNKNQLISYSLDARDSKLDGKRTFYYDNGKVKNVFFYKNNKKEGAYIEYYENGNVYIKGEYCENKKNGMFITTNEKGVLCGKEYWIDGNKVDKKI